MAESFLNFILDYRFWGMTGMMVGATISVRNAMKNGLSFPAAVVSITAFVYVALIGSRALYIVVFYPELFASHLPLALAFWQDTGTWFGVPIFGPIGAFIILTIAKQPFWTHLGSFVPGLALAHVITRIGCLCEGCCFGAPTSLPWAIYSKRLGTMVHPTQVYSMIGELTSFVILQLLWRKKEFRPYLFPLYGMLFATHRFVSEFFRGVDAGPAIVQGLRIFQLICICLFVCYLCVGILLKWKKRGIPAAATIVCVTIISAVVVKSASKSESSAARDKPQRHLIIARAVFSDQLSEWKARLTRQGVDVSLGLWEDPPSAKEIKEWIKTEANVSLGTKCYILLVGDCASENDPPRRWHIPSIAYTIQEDQWTSAYFTDVPYGDLDDDGKPDVSVGRLTVQNHEQLTAQLAKIGRYKNRTTAGSKRNRVVVWLGAEGYMPLMQNLSVSMIKSLPEWIAPFVMRAHPSSPAKWKLEDQPRVFLQQFSHPFFLSLVVSHGSFRSITLARGKGKDIFLSVEDVNQITSIRPSGMLFLLGCSAGSFNRQLSVGPSLAEAFAGHAGGPIGVFAATGVTGPITTYLIISALIEQLKKKPDTIGDLILGIQRNLSKAGKPTFSKLSNENPHAKAIAAAMPANEKHTLEIPDLLRHEAFMYNLIGDPSCRLTLSMDSDTPLN